METVSKIDLAILKIKKKSNRIEDKASVDNRLQLIDKSTNFFIKPIKLNRLLKRIYNFRSWRVPLLVETRRSDITGDTQPQINYPGTISTSSASVTKICEKSSGFDEKEEEDVVKDNKEQNEEIGDQGQEAPQDSGLLERPRNDRPHT
ncbi:hypothetical protein BpHYR1_042302 [Brachionus plicatilis]|uniref:Uncharacterized protein n=1 Tax=Brachionus plicatilis TaxID=10195 RepID=A0A3M7RT10_BRAPC|nr:hypothetical protein BpHYR1_042302 [Brachionus plicatilis]